MLKANIKSDRASRLAATVVLACLGLAPTAYVARAEAYYTTRELLAEHFERSERVTYLKVRPDAEQRARIERRLGAKLPKNEFIFYIGMSHGKIDGYAIFDEERGQHEPISFATFFDGAGAITRVEIVAYREPYGDGIRARRFRRQFVGRSADSGFRPNRDIDTISGATISSRSMCTGVRRASILLSETLLRGRPQLAAAE